MDWCACVRACVCVEGCMTVRCWQGVEGVLEVYRQCTPEVKFYGPTNFAEVCMGFFWRGFAVRGLFVAHPSARIDSLK